MAFTSMPIGGIFPMMGVYNTFGDYTELNLYPLADWAKFCDGSVITDVDSPLNGTYVPDLTASIPVGQTTAGIIIPKRQVASGIFCGGMEHTITKEISTTENTRTAKFFMRIK